MPKFLKIIHFVLDRFKERSTWQAIGFLAAFIGYKNGVGTDWGDAAGFAAIVVGVIQMMLPDKKND